MLVYLPIYLFAILEGEIYYITMCVAAAADKIAWQGVLIAGALGGSAGDQFWFYAFRGPFKHLLERYPRLARKRDAVGQVVEAYAIPLAAACRFLPGLRIAIPAACAATGIPAPVFSVISLVSAFGWAAAILGLIAGAGPNALNRLGMARNWALGASAIVVLALFIVLGRITLGAERRAENGHAAH